MDTALHHDSTDNFALQLMGTKRWSLFPPPDARFLYNACSGGFCKGQKLEHPDKPKSKAHRRSPIQSITVVNRSIDAARKKRTGQSAAYRG